MKPTHFVEDKNNDGNFKSVCGRKVPIRFSTILREGVTCNNCLVILKMRDKKASTQKGKIYEMIGEIILGGWDSKIQKVLDEAKADFPKEAGFGFNENGTKIFDVYAWFEKWFGASFVKDSTQEGKTE